MTVPEGYIKAEKKYTINESSVFDALSMLNDSAALETARTSVLEKRIEFYALYLAGKANIEPPLPKVEKTTFQKVMGWLWDGQ